MTTNKIKRTELLTFMDVTPDTEDYALVGAGVVSGNIEYNPETSSETYISDDSATVLLESYAPTMPIEATAIEGDDVFDFIDGLRISRAVLDDAETTIVNVWNYKTGGPTAAPAEQQKVAIAINSYGGDGGKATKISYTIHFIDDPIIGTFNTSTLAFTAS
jgi:hypothetical protein